MSLKYADEESLGRAMFGPAELGDVRRIERLVETFDRCRRHPGGTLPDKLSSPADLKALYRLCASEAVTHAALVAAMRDSPASAATKTANKTTHLAGSSSGAAGPNSNSSWTATSPPRGKDVGKLKARVPILQKSVSGLKP